MKRLLLLFFCFTSFAIYANTYKVLFIGNSYTSVNDLPQLVRTVLQNTGDEYVISSSTPGGCTFANHLTQSISLIQQGGWDYVILQEQSQLPSFPDNQFMYESYPYAQQLCQQIRTYSPDAQIIFYMTWGRENGDQQNCQYFPPLCTYEGMDSLLNLRYMMMAEDNQSVVSPVGALWHYIRVNHPSIQLYQSDESHPSLVGSYAAACSFYTIFTQSSPSSIDADCGVEASVAAIIRDCAKKVVYDSLDKWMFRMQPDTLGVENFDPSVSLSIVPNPVQNSFRITFETVEPMHYNLFIYDVNGRLCAQHLNNDGVEVEIDFDNFRSGLYMVKIITDEGRVFTKKFMKE